MDEENFLDKPVVINLKKLKLRKTIKKYKLPLFLGLLGLILISSGIFSLYYFSKNDSKIEVIPAESNEQKVGKEIQVDVSGSVYKPGVYKLTEGSRLQDALLAAGGLNEEADRDWVEKNLNLAVKLVDGNKVYIPKIDETKIEAGSLELEARQDTGGQNTTTNQVAGVVTGKININTASAAELDTLYGVGEKTAQKIITNRPYSSIEELVNRKVIYKSTFEKIKDKLSVY